VRERRERASFPVCMSDGRLCTQKRAGRGSGWWRVDCVLIIWLVCCGQALEASGTLHRSKTPQWQDGTLLGSTSTLVEEDALGKSYDSVSFTDVMIRSIKGDIYPPPVPDFPISLLCSLPFPVH
jgi:hypothetical protein